MTISKNIITRRQLLKTLGTTTAFLLLPTFPAPLMARKSKRKKKKNKSTVTEIYKGKRGTTIYLKLQKAPFPFKGEPYKDSTTIVFVPHHYRVLDNKVDTVVHFHGHNTTAIKAKKQHQLREQFNDSKQNGILVIPQGPVNAKDSCGGKLDKKDGLLDFLGDLRKTLQSKKISKQLGKARIPKKARIGMLCLSSHSGGYRVAAKCLKHGGFNVNEVWLFDSLYGEVETFKKWVVDRKKKAGKERHKIVSYHGGGRPQKNGNKLMKLLKKNGVDVLYEKKEGDLTRAQLTKARAVFIKTAINHRDLTHKYNNLRDCLFASVLKRRLKSKWFKDKHKKRKLEKRK